MPHNTSVASSAKNATARRPVSSVTNSSNGDEKQYEVGERGELEHVHRVCAGDPCDAASVTVYGVKFGDGSSAPVRS